MKQSDSKRLEVKKAQLRAELNRQKKRQRLNNLLSEAQIQSGTVVINELPKSRIIQDTWKYEPRIKGFSVYPCRSEEDCTKLVEAVKNWIRQQSTQTFLLENENLSQPGEWLSMDKEELLEKLGVLVERFRLLESILVAIDSQHFISLVDCENEVTLFQGYIDQKNEVIYNGP